MTTEPSSAELHESACNHFSRGNAIEAAKQLMWALIADPLYAEAWHTRAMVLRALNDPFDAILCCDRAIDINPCVAAYHNTKGVCFAAMNQIADAVACYDEAIENNPDMPEAWHNKGTAAKMAGLFADAVVYYEKAVSLRPGNHDYHLAYSSALLASGRLAEGWHEYEHRNLVADAFHRHMPLPEWDGSACDGVVIYAEQGFGDAIQFMRYAPILKHRYFHYRFINGDPAPVTQTKFYVEVKKPLYDLALTMKGIDGVICYGQPLPKDATHCLPMLSAPRFAGTDTVDDIPADVPYFHVPKDLDWDRLLNHNNLCVGLCWNAGVRPYQPELLEFATAKSIAPQFLQPLNEIPDVTWVSLQLPANTGLPFPMVDFTKLLFDFYETAKLIQSLDLVVSVDTSVAHLAGALNKDCIVMSPHANCWRWFGDSESSPWYPSITQFRQKSPGDWPSVIERVKHMVEQRSRAMVLRNVRVAI